MPPSDECHITTELRRIQSYVRALPHMRDASELDRAHRHAAATVINVLNDALKLANDAAKTDKPDIKRASLQRCKIHLDEFREALLVASTLDMIDAVDVAHISALADRVNDLVAKEQQQLEL